jgi:hypothetical protein
MAKSGDNWNDRESQYQAEKKAREARAADRRNTEAQHRKAGDPVKQEKAGNLWSGKHGKR